MRRIGLVVLGIAFIGIAAQLAAAHPVNRFRACTKEGARGCMQVGAQIPFDATVVLKGKVRPLHAGVMADVLRRNPHGHVWREVGQVRVSDGGTLRYRWPTTYEDARRKPYLFKFRIPGHGRSNVTEAEVFFHSTPSPPPAAP